MAGTFEDQKAEFADWLVQLRIDAGYGMAKDFAEAVGWIRSKLSKVETGRQIPDDKDLKTWMQAVKAEPELVAEAERRLRELRQAEHRWRRQLRHGHRRRQERDAQEEGAAKIIRAVDLLAVPGLLQTPQCIRRILLTQAELLGVPADDVDAAVRARVGRQQVLYDDGKQIEILTTEAALGMGPFTKQEKLGQIDRLMSAAALLSDRFGLIPRFAELPNLVLHGWWIVDDEVVVELEHTEVRTSDPNDVALYKTLTDRLWSVAVTGEAARAVLVRVAASLADES